MRRKESDGQEFTDLELITECIGGDKRSRELLYKRYFSYAMSICIRYAKDENDAMEIVNDSYMKILDSLGDYDSSRPFKPWYARTLVNTAIDNYRKNVKFNSHLSISLSVNDILTLYKHLPENFKVTFNLYEIEGYSHEEIGQMMGVTASTSRSNLTRAKKMLRELYNKSFNPFRKSHEAV